LNMRKEITLALIALALAGGFLLGRQFPAHHYEHLGGAIFLDNATGTICTSDPNSASSHASCPK
jgi:hypothetical protein